MLFHLNLIFVLCSAWITSSYGSLTMKMLKNRNVIITGPQDVDVFYTSTDKIIISWTLPHIYVDHDASDETLEKVKSGDKINILKPLFSYQAHELEKLKNATLKSNNTESDDTNGGANTTVPNNEKTITSTPAAATVKATDATKEAAASQTTKADDKGKVTSTPASSGDNSRASKRSAETQPATKNDPIVLNHVICKALTEFADFTVEGKDPAISDNGWAVSLLESDVDIKATNMSMYYSEKKHKVVKFEEGCVDKVVVTYGMKDRPGDTEIVLNATNHIATIDNLKSETEYKIVVTAHFVSGDSISAPAIFVPTTKFGFNCRCDRHGTKDHGNNCENPSPSQQHCECNKFYTGKFCQECVSGYYRRSPDYSCKSCPCKDYSGVQSSCEYDQGFINCHSCAKGYAGNTCHRCDRGYFRYKNQCRECHCNNNTQPGTQLVCDPTTGTCNNCSYNTTGFYCERCLRGYIRHPRHTGKCYAIEDVGGSVVGGSSKSSSGVSTGVVGAIVFVIVLFVCVAVGLFVIRRVRANRQRRALWTVEMRPDNDDLDFNSVPNEDARMDEIDDMDFYDRQTGRSKAGGKYSKLNEEF